ncbi:MAG: hypothetical protein O2890_06935 [Cyanobacteria bacterium]|nr:hypothetical protein [Cyanobacteriota bacterium]MDA0866140.1 hypothetical protein [Cyanobacteriota bacterium]
MNSSFVEAAHQADGRYLSDQELRPLEMYLTTFATRMEAYQTLRDNADSLVMQALRRLVPTHRRVVQEHGGKCKRDMAYTLSYVARAVLSDDTNAFRQDFLLWMGNIAHALHKSDSSSEAYGCLKQEIHDTLPPQCAVLVTPYLDELINTFSHQ